MKHFIVSGLCSLLLLLVSCGENRTVTATDRESVISSLDRSAEAWNRRDFEGYMSNYWRSDSLKFVSGTRGISYGWDTTLSNYKKAYPDEASSGKLTFDTNSFEYLGSRKFMLVIGSYTLEREDGEMSGYFTLIWEKIDGEWFITTDFTY